MEEIKYDLTEAEELLMISINRILIDFGSDLKRERAIELITSNICIHCGQNSLPCYCMNDD